MRDRRNESSGEQPDDDDSSESERPSPFETLPAWWGPAVSENDRHQLSAVDLDLDKYAFEFGHDDETLIAFAKSADPRRFLVCEELSVTRFAAVYTAIDSCADRPVVLKISLRSVEPEGRQIARISHPHVVMVLDILVCSSYPTIVLEWCSQNSLHDYAMASGDWTRVLARGIEAGRAVKHCHDLGIVHGDLKPTNILVSEEVAKLADFGISRGETLEGDTMGTPGFEPPERRHGVWTMAGDVFSYALTIEASLSRFENFEAPRRLPRLLSASLAAARAEDVKLRPSMAKLLVDLERVLADETDRRVQREQERERQRLGHRRRRMFQWQVALVVAWSAIITSTVVLAGVCSLPSAVEVRKPSIELAIELADAGNVVAAVQEYDNLNEANETMRAADLMRLSTALVACAEQASESNKDAPVRAAADAIKAARLLRMSDEFRNFAEQTSDPTMAAIFAEVIAGRAYMIYMQHGNGRRMRDAAQLRETAHSIIHHPHN